MRHSCAIGQRGRSQSWAGALADHIYASRPNAEPRRSHGGAPKYSNRSAEGNWLYGCCVLVSGFVNRCPPVAPARRRRQRKDGAGPSCSSSLGSVVRPTPGPRPPLWHFRKTHSGGCERLRERVPQLPEVSRRCATSRAPKRRPDRPKTCVGVGRRPLVARVTSRT